MVKSFVFASLPNHKSNSPRRLHPLDYPFVCHSYKKHPGWGSHSSSQNLAVLLAPNHKSPVTASVLSLPQVTSHQSRITKSFIIRTYAKRARNPFRMRTSKTQDLKSFRIRTYKKTGGGYHSIATCSLSIGAGTDHCPTSVFLITHGFGWRKELS
jgi:hypothetical protein